MEELQLEKKKNTGTIYFGKEAKPNLLCSHKRKTKQKPGKGSAGLSASLDLTQSCQKKENQTIPTTQTKSF